MKDTVLIKYSKISSWFGLIFIIGLIYMSYSSFIKFYQNNETINWILIVCFDSMLILFIYFLIIKYLIPGLTGKVAIELNNVGIIENIRKRQMTWDNISRIRLVYSKSNVFIAIDLIDDSLVIYKSKNIFQKPLAFIAKSFYGTQILISTQYIQGKNSDILKQIQTYHEEKTATNSGLARAGFSSSNKNR